ncbi:MAG: nickel-dependent lactate racemase [Desulfobacterales bacterium]|nr:nickel-dependent lactate racemase [Desulfobacterales bacterium]
MRYPAFIEADFEFPEFHRVRMDFSRQAIDDVEAAVNQELDRLLPQSGIRAGDRVAVGVGSRGIDRLEVIVRTVCTRLRQAGARPAIIPAMGSHGGATAEGQAAVLRRLNVTEESCGAPVVSTMDVDAVGTVYGEVPVYFSRDAMAMEHSIAINRVKPHTKFIGPAESGILKMLCVGMGKHRGAIAYHTWAMKHGFFELCQAMGQTIAASANFRFGLAVVENAFDRTLAVAGVPAGRILEEETRLNALAKAHIPRLPFRDLDALVVGRIGKEISGAGMDPNVTGRAFDLMESDFSQILKVKRVAVLNLSARTGGNAIGLGNADFITEKVFQALDYEATLMNALTSLSLRKAFIPVRMPNDRKAIQACFTTIGPVPAAEVRAVVIRDTMHLSEFLISRALKEEVEGMPAAEILAAAPLGFDTDGNLRLPADP